MKSNGIIKIFVFISLLLIMSCSFSKKEVANSPKGNEKKSGSDIASDPSKNQKDIPLCELPVKGIIFDASKIESGDFSVTFDSIFSQNDVIQVENSINACQSMISGRISDFQDKVSELVRKKAMIEGLRNIKDIKARIETLKKEKEKIKETLADDLSQLSFQGLYAVVLEAPFGAKREELLGKAKRFIAPSAINDLRGVAIQSGSVVKDGQMFFDRIVGETSGEMDIEKNACEERKAFNGKTQFFYAAVIKVSPLKGNVNANTKSDLSQERYIVSNMLADNLALNFKKELSLLTNESYAADKVLQASGIISVWQNVINEHNIRAKNKENELLSNLSRSIEAKDIEIKNNELEIEKAQKKMENIFREVSFECKDDMQKCLDNAIGQITQQIGHVIKESYSEKEKEFVFAKEIVRGAGDPAEEIRRLVRDLYNNLKTTYGKREQFMNISVVDNASLSYDKDEQGYYITRKPKSVFIYSYSDSKGDPALFIAMNFSIEEEGSKTVQPKQTS